jgi:DsbC/DsbD-like thiol-disulfide interchange protein
MWNNLIRPKQWLRASCAAVALIASMSVADASSSAWATTEGARLRLVTTGQPDADGNLRGALEVDLKHGWKTYWRDPGSSGVPPSIDLSTTPGAEVVEIRYPAPQRFDDESGAWVGYKHSVVFPLTLKLRPGSPLDAEIFIGVCESICVPFQAKLSLDPSNDPTNADDEALVSSAVEASPREATDTFMATGDRNNETKSLEVKTLVEGDPDTAELFLASEDGYTFGVPERTIVDGKAQFTVKVLDMPARMPTGKGIFYTLATDAGAVQGYLPYY